MSFVKESRSIVFLTGKQHSGFGGRSLYQIRHRIEGLVKMVAVLLAERRCHRPVDFKENIGGFLTYHEKKSAKKAAFAQNLLARVSGHLSESCYYG